jgi:hypothetical protein
MKKEALALLLGYLINQKKEINKLFEETKGIEPASSEKTVYLGYLFHNLYCATEDLLKEIARTFENQIEDPAKYHRELLKRMSIEIPGIRPALLSSRSHKILDELRGFRHTFRHAYSYELDPSKVGALRYELLNEWPCVESDIVRFEQFLREQLLATQRLEGNEPL